MDLPTVLECIKTTMEIAAGLAGLLGSMGLLRRCAPAPRSSSRNGPPSARPRRDRGATAARPGRDQDARALPSARPARDGAPCVPDSPRSCSWRCSAPPACRADGRTRANRANAANVRRARRPRMRERQDPPKRSRMRPGRPTPPSRGKRAGRGRAGHQARVQGVQGRSPRTSTGRRLSGARAGGVGQLRARVGAVQGRAPERAQAESRRRLAPPLKIPLASP